MNTVIAQYLRGFADRLDPPKEEPKEIPKFPEKIELPEEFRNGCVIFRFKWSADPRSDKAAASFYETLQGEIGVRLGVNFYGHSKDNQEIFFSQRGMEGAAAKALLVLEKLAERRIRPDVWINDRPQLEQVEWMYDLVFSLADNIARLEEMLENQLHLQPQVQIRIPVLTTQ